MKEKSSSLLSPEGNIKRSESVKVTEEMIAEAEAPRDHAQLMLDLVDLIFLGRKEKIIPS